MNQYKQKITATLSAILMALALVGLNIDQAMAQGKSGQRAKARASSFSWGVSNPGSYARNAGKGAKVRAGSNANIENAQGFSPLLNNTMISGYLAKSRANRISATRFSSRRQ